MVVAVLYALQVAEMVAALARRMKTARGSPSESPDFVGMT